MTPGKKNDRVAPPAEPGCWLLRFGTTEAAKGWEDLVRQAGANLWAAYEAIRTDPTPFPTTSRIHRLKGELGTIGGLEQWQYEVTAAGRIWYCPDPDRRIVYLLISRGRQSR